MANPEDQLDQLDCRIDTMIEISMRLMAIHLKPARSTASNRIIGLNIILDSAL